MSEVRKQHWCQSCEAERVFMRQRPNRALQTILVILTCGLWLLIWPILAAARASASMKCVVCGSTYAGEPVALKVLA